MNRSTLWGRVRLGEHEVAVFENRPSFGRDTQGFGGCEWRFNMDPGGPGRSVRWPTPLFHCVTIPR
jgi:hypothetical protein